MGIKSQQDALKRDANIRTKFAVKMQAARGKIACIDIQMLMLIVVVMVVVVVVVVVVVMVVVAVKTREVRERTWKKVRSDEMTTTNE